MDKDLDELKDKLQEAFREATKIYRNRGFQRRIGFGRKPALINVDLANAWTRPGNPFTCENIDEQIIPGVQELMKSCREHNHLIVHVTTCFQNTDRNDPHTDMGLWHNKIPVEVVNQKDTSLWAIDTRIAPRDGEHVLIKKRASAFHGTYLSGYLRSAGIDTILVTGVTATACVRETICDGLAEGFRPIAVRECIGDRIPGAVDWNLFDIDAKFGDVVSLSDCKNFLDTINFRND